ncbi:hypothetical protein Gpo141_00010390, partial [Globisporangium polare]
MQLRSRTTRALSSIAAPTRVAVTATVTVTSSSSSPSQSRIKSELLALADAKYAVGATKFFKSDYSQGDVFIGVRVPQCRAVVKAHIHGVTRADVVDLLRDARHEVRIAGGICLVEAFTTPHASAQWLPGESEDAQDQLVNPA